MITNYVKVALRNLWHNKLFSGINLIGLSTGTLCCLYILLYVRDQRRYDRHFSDAERIYRVVTDLGMPDKAEVTHMASCSPPIPPAIKAEFPEVECATRVCAMPGDLKNLIKVGDKSLYEKKGYLVDSTFFQVFDYPFVAGNPATALNEPHTVVISDELAQRLFNTTDAVGMEMRIGGMALEEAFKVSGVFKNTGYKSHIDASFFMTMNSTELGKFVRNDDSWAGNNFIYGYLKLKQNTDAAVLEAKLPDFLQRHGAQQLKELSMQKKLALQPLTAIHTDAARDADLTPGVSNRFLNILLLIAGIIQLIACVNFMNLSTARSAQRAREVGVRKAIGATRQALSGQFLSESLLLTGFSMLLALPLLLLALPWLNQITGTEIRLEGLRDAGVWIGALALLLVTGLAAGSYPAFYLSSFRPVAVLRGIKALRSSGGDAWLRKGLVTGQFVISTVLILGVVIIYRQLDFMLHKDLGFERNQKMLFPMHSVEGAAQLTHFRDELMALPEVASATVSSVSPGEPVLNDISMYKPGADMNNSVMISFAQTDDRYLNTLKIPLLAGRFLTQADTAGAPFKTRVVVNETALKKLGMSPESALGQVLRSDFNGMHFEMAIVGVMQDFHFESLSKNIKPFMVMHGRGYDFTTLAADVKTDDYGAFLKKAGQLWAKTFPGLPFEHRFLDREFARLFEAEQTLGRILGAFTLMAILISCLGLFGLAAYSAERRTKEIGIRKVLGASVAGITAMLARDFLKLVLLAIVIAVPLAWFFMQRWLSGFAYRVSVEPWMFVLAGGIAVLIAALTVSFQSIRAAVVNPVRSLKSE